MSAPFITIPLAAMDALDFPATEWAVDSLIPCGALVLLVGRPKAGKSLLGIDLLASIALGEPFLDRATRQGPVIYGPAEDHIALVRERVKARFGVERAAQFHVLPVDGSYDQSLRLDDDGMTLMRLMATIEEIQPSAMMLDPMRELHAAKENDSDEMAMILRPLRQLAHATGIAIVLSHHKNKHGQDASTAVRGSTAITGGVDVVLTMDTSGDEDSDLTPSQTVTLRAEGRYGPKQRIVAKLGTGLRWEVTNAAPMDTTLAGRIPHLLSAKDEPLDADAIATALNVKKGGTQNALKELVTKSAVVRLGKGTKSAPYTYAHPRVAARMTKDDESDDESPEMAHDEAHDEYSLAAQGETPIRHIPEGYTHEGCDESFLPPLADTDVTKGDESDDECFGPSATPRIIADDLILDAWDVLVRWAHGMRLSPFTDEERDAAEIVGFRLLPDEPLTRAASRIFAGQRAWREMAVSG